MSKKRLLQRFAAVLLWVVAGAAAWGQTQTVAPAAGLQVVDAMGREIFLDSGATGMVLVVVQGRKAVFHGYGETAPGVHQTPNEESVVRLCSLTKIFTTDVLAKLAANKTVRLDDTLQRYAPAGAVAPKRNGAITLLDLATHTSGLPRELGTMPVAMAHFTFPDYEERWHWLPNVRLRSTPGTAALYSNVAFDLLSDALQAATHTPYPKLLAERTLNPLHMEQTTFFPNAVQCGRLLTGAHDERACRATEATAGSSGLYSTAGDMETWLKYLLGSDEPEVPAQSAAAQAIYIQPSRLVRQVGLDHAGKPTGVGMGWIHILPVGSPSEIVQKTGGGAGFSTYIAINHARQTAVFLALTDGAVDTHLNVFNAANKLLLAVAGLPPLPPPPPKPARRRGQGRRRLRRAG